MKSLPFYAILFAHMGHNYGYETLMTELPTYMKQVLRFSLKSNGLLSSLPYLAMWLFSMFISVVADWMISSKRFTHTATRKMINSIGQYGPGIALIAASYTGCDRALTLAILTGERTTIFLKLNLIQQFCRSRAIVYVIVFLFRKLWATKFQ